MEDEDWGDVVEAAAKEAFEAFWEEFLHEEFEPWKKEVVQQCFVDAFIEGGIFCMNVSGEILESMEKAASQPEDQEDESEEE